MIRRHLVQGLSLLELLVTLLILSLLISFASASYEPLIIEQRGSTVLSDLRHLVQFARSEAIKRNQRVVLCPSQNGTSCAQVWSSRVILFADPDNAREVGSVEEVLRDLQLVNPSEAIAYNRAALVFGALGQTLGSNGTFTYCWKNRPGSARGLIVSRLGRLRGAKDYDGDGLREKYPGAPLSCPG